MGFLTATTQLPSLKAVSVGGLVDDFYRGICYVGGVRNCGFPVDWLNSFYRPDGVFGSDRAAQAARGLDEAAFQTIVKGRPAPDLTQDTLWHLLQVPFDGPSWREQSLCTYAARIRAPIIIGHAWQDEQTGPTGWKLWKRIPDDVPKRLFCTNGHHGVGPTPHHAVLAWFDHWLLDQPGPDAWYPASRVSCYFETPNPEKEKTKGRNEPLVAADFPASETRWTRYFLRGQGQLSLSLPSEDMPGRYLVTHSRSHNKDHWVGYELAFKEPTAICGPAILNLWAKLTTIDTDFFVLLADQAPDGSLFGLQRGLLRASHREINPKKSTYLDLDGQKVLLQPFHPHEQARPVRPNEPQQYQIEIPAVGHVFRPGHKLVLILTQPPEGDPIGVTRDGHPSYRYDSHPPPGTVTILHKAGQPSSLLLPVLPMLPPLSADPVPLEKQAGLQPVR
jgi:predicted acyl esterase